MEEANQSMHVQDEDQDDVPDHSPSPPTPFLFLLDLFTDLLLVLLATTTRQSSCHSVIVLVILPLNLESARLLHPSTVAHSDSVCGCQPHHSMQPAAFHQGDRKAKEEASGEWPHGNHHACIVHV